MRITQIIPELNHGGVERGVVELNAELVKRGHQSIVISAGGKQVPQIAADGGKHITLDVCSKNPLTFLGRAFQLKKILRQLQPDILHARSRLPAWLCHFANRSLKIPYVTTVHGFNSVSKYSAVMTQGDAVICVSNPIKEYVQTHYETSDQKITVIHRWVNPTEFDPARVDQDWVEQFKAKHNLHNKRVITSAGRITELKDYETFIRAIAQLDDPNSVGLIVGGVRADKQNYFDRLQALAKELDLESRLIFAGSQSKMPEIYTLSDLLVSCSKKPESFGRTLVEAMAMNTPVLATRHGGALDIITEGETGGLFSVGNVAELVACMKEQHASSLREYVLNHFEQGMMVERIIQVYEKLLEGDR